MEDPKKDEFLIDTSSKKSFQDLTNKLSQGKDLILEEKDEEEDEKINQIENELKENEKLKNLIADINEEEEEEEEEDENENLNYDRHFDRELKVGKDYEYKKQSKMQLMMLNHII